MLNRPWWKREVRVIPRWVGRRFPLVVVLLPMACGLTVVVVEWMSFFAHGHHTLAAWAGPVGWTVFLGIMEGLYGWLYWRRHVVRRAMRRRWERCCVRCGYPLRRLASDRCPECGDAYGETARRDVRLRLAGGGDLS